MRLICSHCNGSYRNTSSTRGEEVTAGVKYHHGEKPFFRHSLPPLSLSLSPLFDYSYSITLSRRRSCYAGAAIAISPCITLLAAVGAALGKIILNRLRGFNDFARLIRCSVARRGRRRSQWVSASSPPRIDRPFNKIGRCAHANGRY